MIERLRFLISISVASLALAACGGAPGTIRDTEDGSSMDGPGPGSTDGPSPDASGGLDGPGSPGSDASAGPDGSDGSGGMLFKIGGSLSGLGSGKSVILRNNGGDDLTLTNSGSFSFSSVLAQGAAYSVTVATQPVGQMCSIASGAGTVGTSDVTTVVVTCSSSATHTIGGTLSGLDSSKTLVLSNNGGDNLTLTANGNFTFATALAEGAPYAVAVAIQPLGQTCTVGLGSGTVGTSDVTSVTVSCVTASFTIGGTVMGLNTGGSVVLQNNGGAPFTVMANGAFTFPASLPSGSQYTVTLATPPVGQMCTVSNGSGTVSSTNITSVSVVCSVVSYTVGGTLSGLATGKSVTLLNNGGDPLTLTNDGTFSFALAVASGAGYAVTVSAQPAGQVCSVNGGTGTIGGGNVTNVSVICGAASYTIGGTLMGLGTSKSLVLRNSGGDDLTLTANGNFTFLTPVVSGGSYNVTIFTQPTGETCSVIGGSSGTVGTSNVTVQISCVANTYTVGGTLTGLIPGRTLELINNSTDIKSLTGNGSFTFAIKVSDQRNYNVTILTQAVGQTCTVMNGSGTINAANVSSVSVSCVANSYTVGGTLTGLTTGKSLVLQNSGGDDLTLTANGTFTFPTAVVTGQSYTIAVATQPTGETCNVTSGSGLVVGSNINSVSVSCTPIQYTVGGTITGLIAGRSLALTMNGTPTPFTASGSFVMSATVPDEGTYTVSILGQPPGQLCTITNGSGTVHAANVTNIAVNCVAAFTVGGTVNNLALTDSVTLQNNGGETKTVTGNQNFTFPTPIANGGAYAVTVSGQPAGKTCTVTNGTGTINGANITNVTVNCSSLTINVTASNLIGGTVSGLFVYSGPTLVASVSSFTLDANGHGVSNLVPASAGQQTYHISPGSFTPSDGPYAVFISVDKGLRGISPGTGAATDDLSYVGTVNVAGPTVLALGNTNFKPYVTFNPSISGVTAVSNFNYFCSVHLPGTNIFADGVQRTSIGKVTGKIDGAGNGSVLTSVAPQGTFDYTCMADNPNAFVGSVELQPFNVQTGNGLDTTFDYLATTNVTISGNGTVPVNFAPSTVSSGTLVCSGTLVSGGNGSAGAGQFNGDNNQAVLAAPTSCSPTGQVAPTTKTIAVNLGTGTGSYSFGTAIAIAVVGNSVKLLVPFTNTSGSARSTITVTGAVLSDGSGNMLSAPPTFTAVGSECAGGIPNCLASGETGYLLGTASTGFATVASVAFSMTDATSAPGLAPKVIPETYTVFDGVRSNSNPEVRIRATNLGIGNADISLNRFLLPALWYVTMDSAGNPNGWDLMTTASTHIIDFAGGGDPILGTSAPLNSLVFTTFTGTFFITEKIKVFMGFSSSTSPPTPNAVDELYWTQVDEQVRTLREAAAADEAAKDPRADWWSLSPATESATAGSGR